VSEPPFSLELSRQLWESRYRYYRAGGPVDRDIGDTWTRVADALASVEAVDSEGWRRSFRALLEDFRFLPGGRILAGAGTDYDVTLFNCFVMGPIEDSMEAIFDSLKEGALTMQMGGGEGYDFSTLRPAGASARRVGSVASGPVSFMRVWDSMCATIVSSGFRRGAMMATLRCDHPDIEAFIDAKRDPGELRNFNLSVLVTDRFMQAVEADADWPLVFPAATLPADQVSQGECVTRQWPGQHEPVKCAVLRSVPARRLWDRLMQAAYDTAEPGVLFIDRINQENNLHYREQISATNPCGEIPLPPYGACNLGSLNLTRFVKAAFQRGARVDFESLEQHAATAVRALDNVVDLSRYPLPAQAEQALGSRRVGLGISGLADMLLMLGVHYASDQAREIAAEVMRRVCHSAYRASTNLAEQKGSFPYFDRDAYLASPFVGRLPADIRDRIREKGIRNSHLTAIAPAGTISLLANNLSSGIEPVFEFEHRRRVRNPDGSYTSHEVADYAWQCWRKEHPGQPAPDFFVAAHSVAPGEQLAMQAALQPHVDSAISKTINVPGDYDYERFRAIYTLAHSLGLKGCTAFRPNAVTGTILAADADAGIVPAVRCCSLERESD
jgi:ribonucleoside-diphosphate reductase alpha chain